MLNPSKHEQIADPPFDKLRASGLSPFNNLAWPRNSGSTRLGMSGTILSLLLCLMCAPLMMVLLPAPAAAVEWRVEKVSGNPVYRDIGTSRWKQIQKAVTLTDSHEVDIGVGDEVILGSASRKSITLRGTFRVPVKRIQSASLTRGTSSMEIPSPISVAGVRGEEMAPEKPRRVGRRIFRKPLDLWSAFQSAMEKGDEKLFRQLFTKDMTDDSSLAPFLVAAAGLVASKERALQDQCPAYRMPTEMRMALEILPLLVSGYCAAVVEEKPEPSYRYRLIDEGREQVSGLPEFMTKALRASASQRACVIYDRIALREDQTLGPVPPGTALDISTDSNYFETLYRDPWGVPFRLSYTTDTLQPHTWYVVRTNNGHDTIEISFEILGYLKRKQTQSLNTLEEYLRGFREANDRNPTEIEGLSSACDQDSLIRDLWGKPVQYRLEGDSYILTVKMPNDAIVELRGPKLPKRIKGLGAVQTKAGVRFKLKWAREERVYLAGSFNDWSSSATPMEWKEDDGGVWEVTVPLKPGKYQYKFVAGGRWFHDPNNSVTIPDGHGGKNSVVEALP